MFRAAVSILSHSSPTPCGDAGWLNLPVEVYPKRMTVQLPFGAFQRRMPSEDILSVKSITLPEAIGAPGAVSHTPLSPFWSRQSSERVVAESFSLTFRRQCLETARGNSSFWSDDAPLT